MAKTTISRDTVGELRTVLTNALKRELDKLGLVASIGRITYEPGREMRMKLVVTQPVPRSVNVLTPATGESWMYAGKRYTITSVDRTYVYCQRPKRGGGVGMYRVKLNAFVAGGVKV